MSIAIEVINCLAPATGPYVQQMMLPPADKPEKKKGHQARVIRIPDIEKHPNADTLGIVRIDGYQLVVKLGEFAPGDLAVYVQPDSIVPNAEEFAFMWTGLGFTEDDEIPVRYRRVTPRRFRKEWSEGLLIHVPLWVRYDDHGSWRPVEEGDDLSDILGITHYDPPEPAERQPRRDRDGRPRSLKGWWYWLLAKLGFRVNGNLGGTNASGPKDGHPRPVYDLEALKNYPKVLQSGEQVIVTEKIHGSNARYTFADGVMHVGSRTLWKSPKYRGPFDLEKIKVLASRYTSPYNVYPGCARHHSSINGFCSSVFREMGKLQRSRGRVTKPRPLKVQPIRRNNNQRRFSHSL